MSYKLRWKRKIFSKTESKVIGHQLNEGLDRMDVFFEDGSIKSIPRWSECTLFLGTDWVLATKREMEEEAGQEIKLKVKA